MNAVSLFSGIGGMDLAFAAAGFDIQAQVEINEFCRRVLEKHRAQYWPNAVIFEDARLVGQHNLPIRPSCCFGGFPCQPFSKAGRRQGVDDKRNLWPEFRRIVSEIRPRALLLENVPGIDQTYKVADTVRPAYALTIIADLAALGYVSRWGVISAADAGAAHLRERIWVVAYAERNGRQESPDQQTAYYTQPDRAVGQSGRHAVGDTVEPGGQFLGAGRPLGSASGGQLPADESQLGTFIDGIPARLARHRRPALQGEQQFQWEPPRTIRQKQAFHNEKMRALGNAVFPPAVLPLALGIRAALAAQVAEG